jgi:hypothetical protein
MGRSTKEYLGIVADLCSILAFLGISIDTMDSLIKYKLSFSDHASPFKLRLTIIIFILISYWIYSNYTYKWISFHTSMGLLSKPLTGWFAPVFILLFLSSLCMANVLIMAYTERALSYGLFFSALYLALFAILLIILGRILSRKLFRSVTYQEMQEDVTFGDVAIGLIGLFYPLMVITVVGVVITHANGGKIFP